MGLLDFLTGGSRREKFARQVLEGIRSAAEETEIRYDKAEFAILFGSDGRFDLHNAFTAWDRAPASQRDAEMAKVIRFGLEVMAPLDNSWEAVAPLLLPAVRNRSHMTNEWLGSAESVSRDAYSNVVRPLGESYQIALVIDRDVSIQRVTAATFEEWGKSYDEVERVAVENLRTRSACRFERSDGGFFISEYRDFHDSARLLLPDLFEPLGLRGDPLVIPLSRTCLLVSGSGDTAALEAMAAAHGDLFAGDPRPTGIEALVLRGKRWETAGDEISPVIGRLRFDQASWDYAEQKAALEHHFKKTRRDVFIPRLMVFEHETRGLLSWTSWTQDVPSLLPKSDVVGLTSEDLSETLNRSWADVMEICGPAELEPDVYPHRWVRESGPTAEQWERLRARPDPMAR